MAKAKKRGTPSNIALDASTQRKFNQKVHRISKKVKDAPAQSGVVYVSHLPWGFEEKPLKEYFKQFGTITQLRVARSKKTGNSRGFAYIQFEHDEVAKIVGESMNNYLMFGKLVKCRHLVNPHPNTFKNAHRKFVKPMGVAAAIRKHNSFKSEEIVDKRQKKMLGKLDKLHAKLAAQGIEYKLEDTNLSKVRETLQKKKEEKKKVQVEKKKKADKDTKKRKPAKVDKEDDEEDDDESDDDNVPLINDEDNDDESDSDDGDDSDSIADDIPLPATRIQKAAKQKGQKTPKNLRGTPKPINILSAENKSGKKTNKRQSLIPTEVDTPKGKMSVLIEDSSDEEISFKTPPMSIKSSKLDDTLTMKGTPVSTEKRSPKRKLEAKTPVSVSKKGKGMVTPEAEVPMKKAKFLSKSAQKANTPKLTKSVKMPKSAQRMNTAKVDESQKKDLSTPKNVSKGTERPGSGRKTSAKKKLPSATKRKR